MARVTIVGAGMAGSEAALQLARRGIDVRLVEMRPVRQTEAHQTDGMAELVCSNSFRGAALMNAVGLLKEEMRRAGGVLMDLAEDAAVPAGGALAVDRERFSSLVTEAVMNEPRITVVREELTSLPEDELTILATGPLTSGPLANALMELTGEDQLYFYDAIAPILDAESIDRSVVFEQSRYDKGGTADYLNCPMTREEYEAFVQAIVEADKVEARAFEEAKFFEACLPVEVLASRGVDTLRYGAMKPVGLTDPRTGQEPWAVVQLRMENLEGTAYNMVGFQTRLKWGMQKEIFSTIPGLQNVEFLRFGSIHRNTFVHGPKVLTERLSLRARPNLRLAGQVTGVEGYVESMAVGLVVGQLVAAELLGVDLPVPPEDTALGGLIRHVTGVLATDNASYQPSNVNWSMLPSIPKKKIRQKVFRRLAMAERALDSLESWLAIQEAASIRLPGFELHRVDEERAQLT